MVKNRKTTQAQAEAADLMRSLRLSLGMTMPNFGKMFSIDANNLNQRELHKTPWKDSEIDNALTALRIHLFKSIELLDSISKRISPNKTTPKS